MGVFGKSFGVFLICLVSLSVTEHRADAARSHQRRPAQERPKRVHKKRSFKKSVSHFHKFLKHTPREERHYLTSEERKRDVESLRARDEIYLKQLWKLSSRSAKEVCREGISVNGVVSAPCLRAQTQKIDVGRVLFEKALAKRGVMLPADMNRALASD